MENQFPTILKEFETMRNTFSGMVLVMKQQDARISELEQKLANVTIPTKEQILLERYRASSARNRTLHTEPVVVAYAAHLLYIKQVPASRIADCGLLTPSRAHGLSSWDTQHLMDFCELNGLLEVYQNGLDEQRVREIVPKYETLKAYLQRKQQES